MRYLKSTVMMELNYQNTDKGEVLTGYVDSNYAVDRDNRKSNTCHVLPCLGLA